jgi:hypothetical protein
MLREDELANFQQADFLDDEADLPMLSTMQSELRAV